MSDGPVLFVASVGGHLAQLIELEPRIALEGSRRWVTFESPQSTSALRDADVDYVRYIPPRGFGQVARALPSAAKLLRRHRPSAVVSTGAAVAVAFLPLARAMRIPAYYIESATRSQGPSVTGKVLARVPGMRLYTQHPGAANNSWNFVGSVFDGFETQHGPARPVEKVVVILGTMETYGFRRLVERVLSVLSPEVEVVWQTGATDVADLDINAREAIPSEELDAAITDADVVIAHAGSGSALTCLRLGKLPVLVPRRAAHSEHVDDHQALTSDYLGGLGLAVVAEADELDDTHLTTAAGASVNRDNAAAALQL